MLVTFQRSRQNRMTGIWLEQRQTRKNRKDSENNTSFVNKISKTEFSSGAFLNDNG